MNTINTSLKTLVILLVTVLLCGVAYAWTPPTVAPPNPVPGVTSPINTSSLAQTKVGNLTVGALNVTNRAIFGGSIKIGNEAVPIPCSSTSTGSIRYNTTINNVEICNGTEWRALYTSVTSNSSGTGLITCNADKCVATCAADGSTVTLARNQTKFCTKTGTATSNVWGTSGGYLNASINKKNFGWVAAAVNYSVTCNFFERSSWVFMLNCRDNYGSGMPSSINLYTLQPDWNTGANVCTPTYRNYTTGTTHTEADFTNINCTSSGNTTALVYTNSTCTGPTTRMYCFEETDTSNTKYQVRNNVVLSFGSFPENWTSVDTNF